MMYCPKCAAPHSEEQKYCRNCGFDLQIVSRVLDREASEDVSEQTDPAHVGPVRTRRAKMEFRGLMALFSALMVGCLIPIAMGLFPNWAGLNNFIILLGGIAGFILFGGILLLVYSDYLPKTEPIKQPVQRTPLSPSIPTNQLPPADPANAVPSATEATTDLLRTPAGKDAQAGVYTRAVE